MHTHRRGSSIYTPGNGSRDSSLILNAIAAASMIPDADARGSRKNYLINITQAYKQTTS
jgi:hypothetical protein